MTANDPSRQQEAATHGDAELPGQSNRSNTQPVSRRFRRLRPEGALLHRFEERPKSGLVVASCCECPNSSSFQERFSRPSISTHQMIDQHAQTVVSPFRVMACFRRWFRCPPPLPAAWPCTRATPRGSF